MDHAGGGCQFKRLVIVSAIQNSRRAPGHQAELGFGNTETVHPGIDGKQAVALRAVPFKGKIVVDAEGFRRSREESGARKAGCTAR